MGYFVGRLCICKRYRAPHATHKIAGVTASLALYRQRPCNFGSELLEDALEPELFDAVIGAVVSLDLPPVACRLGVQSNWWKRIGSTDECCQGAFAIRKS
jgi:hypothetical protein